MIKLNEEQQAILDGRRGDVMAKVMKTLVMYGETFGAERMLPLSEGHGHLVTSFGLSVMKPVYALMEQLIAGGALSAQSFSVDPRPLDSVVPANLWQRLFFKIMYAKQTTYEEQLRQLGLMAEDAFTCTCYMDEVGNKPREGDILSWSESSAVVYANSVLGARCNRNSGIIDLFGSIVSCVPDFGLLRDEGRQADWIIEVACETRPEAQLLGSAIGMKVMEAVPYIKGLTRWLGTDLNAAACDYLKDMGAATASNGAVGLYHVDQLTPEAKAQGDAWVKTGASLYHIDDAELLRVKRNYPLIWKNPAAQAKLCFIGCPHLSLDQLKHWTEQFTEALKERGQSKLALPTVLTAAPAVVKAFQKTADFARLSASGARLSSICPLMYMNNPLCGKMPVITNSNKLRTYTSARYYCDAEILQELCPGGKRS